MTNMGGRKPTDALVEAVWAKTEGNPFLITQVTRLLMEEGDLDRSDRRIELLRIPEEVHVTLLRRLETLSHDCRHVLSVGSVVGRQFTLATVARASGLDPEALVQALDGAVAARLVQALAGDHTFRFLHNLTREAIYADLGIARRMRLHGEVGDALETVYATHLDDRVDEIAHHYRKAAPLGWAEKAIEYSLRAGRSALARCAWQDARLEFEQCIEIADSLPGDDPRRSAAEIEGWEALGDVAAAEQDYDRARAAYERALARRSVDERIPRARLRGKIAEARADQREAPGAWKL